MESPPESPTPAGRGKHSAPVETAQMSVLGRDGRDLIDSCEAPPPSSRAKKVAAMASKWKLPSRQVDSSPQSSSQPVSLSWWDGITTTASRWHLTKASSTQNANDDAGPSPAHDALEAAYASFDDESLASTLSSPAALQGASDDDGFVAEKSRRSRYGRSRGNKQTVSLLQPQLEEGIQLSEGTSTKTALTKEDKIRQDCSFFYTDLDDLPSPRRKPHQSSFRGISADSYSEMMQLEPSRAAFQARYEQLNAQQHVGENDDLALFLEDEKPFHDAPLHHSPQFPRVAEFSNSSLYYQQDGKTLMRLPQDKVKLIMDSQLEAGILSMENTPYNSKEPWKEQELSYVLTVDDDLYRRIFKEMADSYKTPCGLYYCCQEAESTGRVHIHIAMALLFCVLVFLLVNTIIFPLD